MPTVKEHYENHLADHYTWMLGDFEERINEEIHFFKSKEIFPDEPGQIALDLGCGSGIHSIALAKLGFQVNGIDFNQKLLSELQTRKGNLPIHTICCDILEFDQYRTLKPDLITCMGDTLTHLNNMEEVAILLEFSGKILQSKGKLVLAWRDFSAKDQEEPVFIPVKADDFRLLTCMLDFNQEKVKITDIIWVKVNGTWKQKISWYKKLRISKKRIEKLLISAGLRLHEVAIRPGEMSYAVAIK